MNLEVVLAILSVDWQKKTAVVAWFDDQLALNKWFRRWAARGGGMTILEQDAKAAIANVTKADGQLVSMIVDENSVAAAAAFTGTCCHAHLEVKGEEISDGNALITFLIA